MAMVVMFADTGSVFHICLWSVLFFPQLGFALGVLTSFVQRVRAKRYHAWLGAPARGRGAPPATKTIEANLTLTKRSVKKTYVFPVKNFGASPCIVSSWSAVLPGRFAEIVCEKLSVWKARGGSMR